MLTQSASGNVYAVIANDTSHELSLMPTVQVMSTTVFLVIRCRFKSLVADYFDPMLVPKTVLVGGIERSKNTLRGTVMLATGFTLEKIGSGFPALMADRLLAAAPGFLLPNSPEEEKAALYAPHIRSDFATDFAQLVNSAIEPVYPAKDFSGAEPLMTAFDLSIYAAGAGTAKSGFSALPGGKVDPGANVKKVPIGGDDEPMMPEGVVAGPGTKVHLFGKAPPVAQEEAQGATHSEAYPEPADH